MNKRDIRLNDRLRITKSEVIVKVVNLCNTSWFIQDYVLVKSIDTGREYHINPEKLRELSGRKEKVHLI